jgi:hypothetical protein
MRHGRHQAVARAAAAAAGELLALSFYEQVPLFSVGGLDCQFV